MADILDIIKQSGEQIGLTKDQINEFAESFSNLSEKVGVTVNVTETLNNVFTKLADNAIIDSVRNIGKSLQDTSLLTEKQANTLSNLNAVIGVTAKSFTGFGADNLNTFKGQLDDVFKMIDNSTEPLKDLKKLASALKIPTTGLESFGKLKELVQKYAGNMAENADEALRFQNTILKTSASAGSLGKVMQQAGEDFKNLNNLIVAQTDYLNQVKDATQEQPKVIKEYYAALAQIPGALDATVEGSKESQKNINMLTAAMQFSKGSGREFTEVVKDLDTAFVDYNMVGEDALRFTSRIGQLSSDYNIQLDKVRSAITSASKSLRMFGHDGDGASRMMEGASKVMNNYIQALKDTGISGAAAMDVITNMTQKVGDLNIASRSFISSQTGGPGGLRGAFKIEQMMREGKMDEVMEKVRKTMTQQFGRIVSVEEAAGSERSASMLVKQRQMLMEGPLGGFARNEQEAGRLVEAFAAMEKGGGTKNLEDILQKTMSRGEELQKQTATPVSMIRSDVSSMRSIMQAGGLANFQRIMAASVGKNVTLTPAQEQRMKAISGRMATGVARGGKAAEVIGGDKSGINNTLYTKYLAQEIDDFKVTLTDILPKAFKGMVEELGLDKLGDALENKLNESVVKTDKMVEASKNMTGNELEKIQKEIAKRRQEEASISEAIVATKEFKSRPQNTAEVPVQPNAMRAAAKSRYDFGEETAPARVAAAIPETGPAVAAAGGVPGRGDEGERSEVTVKIEPETVVFELKNEDGDTVSSQSASLSSTQNVKRGK